MPGLSFTKKQLTEKYLNKLVYKVIGNRSIARSSAIFFPMLSSNIDLAATRKREEREYNQIIARHLREAREREAAGELLTEVQKTARYWRGKEESDDRRELENLSRIRYSPEERASIQRIIDNRARARIEADRAEEERELPSYNPSPIPAPPYRGRKTPWRTLKSKMTKTLFGSRKKTSSPAPLYYPPRYSDIEVGGRRSSGRRKTRKVRRH
jgi:hypothetical protein